MVQIPTETDIARVSARSGRIAPNGPVGGIGRALQDFGQNVVRAAYDLNDLRAQEQADQINGRSNEVSTSLQRFIDDEEQRYRGAVDKASASGVGFTRQYMEGYQQRANEFAKANFVGLSSSQQTEYLNHLLSTGNSLFAKADTFEGGRKKSFYDLGTNTTLDGIRTRIRSNASPFDELKKQGLDAINSAPMDDAWKNERRAAWLSDAAESKVQWDFERDPVGTISKLRTPAGGSSNVVDKIIGVESGGKASAQNPKSTAGGLGQFIDSTWLATVRQHRPDAASGKSAAEILAMKKDRSPEGRQFQREMLDALTADNTEFLSNEGIATTDGNVYLAHFLGPRGAVQVLKADPSASVESIVGSDAVRANPFLRGMSVADIKAWSDKKMGSAPSSYDPAYDGLSYDKREQLLGQAETAYQKQQTDEAAQEKVHQAKTRDTLSLGIETGAIVTPQEILGASIDDGDKATLLKALRSKQDSDGNLAEAVAQFRSGTLSVDPYDDKGRKTVDALYGAVSQAVPEDQKQAATEEIVRQTGVVPKQVMSTLRQGANSQNPVDVLSAAQAAQRISTVNPSALSMREGGADVQRMADDFRHYVNDLNLAPEDAAKRIADANDPAKQRDRKAIEPAAKEFVKSLQDFDLASQFNDSWFAGDPSIGFTPSQELGIKADFLAIAEDQFYQANGDPDLAKARAIEEMKRLYGVTDFGGVKAVVKHPPEMYWPKSSFGTEDRATRITGSGGQGPGNVMGGADAEPSLDYAHRQLQADVTAAEPDADPSTIQLVTTPETDAMVKRGEMPAYAILYKDKNGAYQTIPGKLWRPDISKASAVNAEKAAADKAEAERKARVVQDVELGKAERVNRPSPTPEQVMTPPTAQDILSGNDPVFGAR